MRKMLMVMVMLIGAAGEGNTQPDSLWSRTFDGGGSDGCYSVIQTADGGFALAGKTGSGNNDFWLVRTNADGDSLWSRTFGGRERDVCYSLIETADGGFLMAGFTMSFGAGDADYWLVRTNAEGDSLWSRTFGGEQYDWCFSLIETSDGGFILAGTTLSFGAGQRDVWVVRTNSDGDSLWSRTFGGEDDEEGNSIITTADEGFALAGSTESFSAVGKDFWLLRTNADGDSIWSRTYGGESADWCNSLVQTADGGFALTGNTESYGAGNYDFWLVRTNAEGDSLWSRTFGGGDYEECNSLIQTADGGFVLAGQTHTFGVYRDFWLVRTNTDGDSLWSRTFGGGSWDDCHSLNKTVDGGFVLAGETNSFDINNDFWLVKTCADPVSVSDSPFQLSTFNFQLCPNPFNASTTFTYSLPHQAPIQFAIYDLSGRLIETLAQGITEAGEHSVVWTAPGSGVYFAALRVKGEEKAVRKVVCVR